MILQKILYSKMNTSLCCIKNYQAINFKIWPLWSKILIHSSRHASRVNSDIPRSLMLRYDTKFRFGCQEIRTFCLCRSKKLNSYTILLRRKFCTNVKNEKAGIPEKYRRGEIKRLLSIATPEKWRIAGLFGF